MRGDLEVELDIGLAEVVAGHLADPPEAVLERAAVARLGGTKLLANAGADLVVWSLDEVSRPALAEGLLERKRNTEA